MEEQIYHPAAYRDYNWQMGYANPYFDLHWFLNCKNYRETQILKKEYSAYRNEPMHPYIIDYWQKKGIRKEYSRGNRGQEKDPQKINDYAVLFPEDSGKTPLPLVYYCHGGGEECFDAEMCGLAERIENEPFIFAAPNRFGPEEFLRILAELKEKAYPIDEQRIYVMGFSGGSGSAAAIAAHYPELIAGAALIPGANAINQLNLDKNLKDHLKTAASPVPLICIGGTCDGGDNWPLVDDISYENFNWWMKYISCIPEFQEVNARLSHSLYHRAESQVQSVFGLAFDREYINEFDDTFCYVGDYLGTDGTALARFISAAGMPHGSFPGFVNLAWTYLKKFSKDQKSRKLNYEVPGIDYRTWRQE